MRIAHIVCSFPPYQGGIGNSCFNQARKLSKNGHQVTVFTPHLFRTGFAFLREAQSEKGAGFTPLYEKISGEGANFNFEVIRLKPFIKYGMAAFLPQLPLHLKKFDLIHLHYPFFGAAEMISFFKKPVVLQYHMDVVGSGLMSKIFKLHTKYVAPKIIEKADLIICSSFDYLRNSNLADFYKKEPNKFRELPFGVDLNIFTPREKDLSLLSKYGFKKEEQIILFVGGLDKAHYFKGVENLIRAFSKIYKNRAVSLILAGEGELKSYYQKIARDLGMSEKIIFVGMVSNDDLSKYYNLADIFTLPSIDGSEAFGLVLLEAMACGRPIIASSLPGVRTIVDDYKTGLLVKPNNIIDLAEKLNYLLENSDKQKEFGQNARKKVEENYDWNKIIEKLEKIYFDLLKNDY